MSVVIILKESLTTLYTFIPPLLLVCGPLVTTYILQFKHHSSTSLVGLKPIEFAYNLLNLQLNGHQMSHYIFHLELDIIFE